MQAADIHGSGDFILNDGTVYSDTGDLIGSRDLASGTVSMTGGTIINGGTILFSTSLFDILNDPSTQTVPQASSTAVASATNGTVAKSPDLATYAYGETVTLTATADPGYKFVGWAHGPLDVQYQAQSIIRIGNGESIPPTQQGTSPGGAIVSRSPVLKVRALADYQFTARFEPISRVISVEGTLAWPRLVVGESASRQFIIGTTGNSPLNVSGIVYPEGYSGAWTGEIAPGQTREISVTFTPPRAGTFSGNIVVQSDATAGTPGIPVSAVAEDVFTLSAKSVFTRLAEGVSQNTLPMERRYWAGSQVHVVASPVTGYQFVNWTEDGQVVSRNANFNLRITETGCLVAHYASNTPILEAPGLSNFGEKKVGSANWRYLTFRNTGNMAVYVSGWRVDADGSRKGQDAFRADWTGWIAPGASQRVAVRFKPLRKQRYVASIVPLTTDANARVSAARVGGSGR